MIVKETIPYREPKDVVVNRYDIGYRMAFNNEQNSHRSISYKRPIDMTNQGSKTIQTRNLKALYIFMNKTKNVKQ